MKAIVIPEYGEPEVLSYRDVPDPQAGPDDLRITVRAAALNRGDLLQRRGLYPPPGPKPEHEIPGLEYTGEVVEVGARGGRLCGWRPRDGIAGGSRLRRTGRGASPSGLARA